MNTAETRTLIDDYVSLDLEIKKLEKRRNALKEQIISLGEGAHRANVGMVNVTLSQRSLLDQEKLKAKFGDEVADCYKISTSITVRVTEFEKEVA